MHLACRLTVVTWLVSLMSLAGALGQEVDKPISDQQKADITAANSPEALIDLAKGYALQRSFPAAAAAIQKAMQIKPELLADAKRQSPRSWHAFWFTQRAMIIEEKLPKNHAAGRVTVAKWLYEAGLTSQAAEMLKNALAIDANHAEARELARQWNLGAGGPIRVDFTYALTDPLFRPELHEQNVDILIQRNNVFLIVPVAYNTTDPKLNITKPTLKVTTEENRICPVRGIALLESESGSSPAPDSRTASLPKLRWPASSEPLWERVQVQQKADKSGYELACYNQSPPIPKPQRPVPGAPRARVTPPPRPTPSQGGGLPGRETREATGYAAFVVEAPQTAKAFTFELRGGGSFKADATLLQALGVPKEAAAPQRDNAIGILLGVAGETEGVLACAAVAKLAALRFSGPDSTQQPAAALNPALVQKIDQALLSAFAHADGPTRQMAFDVILRRAEAPPEPLLAQIRSYPQPAVLLAMLETIRSGRGGLSEPQPPPENGQPAPPSPASPDMGNLPASTAPPALFAAITACMAHSNPGVRDRAIGLLLADASRESVEALSKAVGPARDAIAAQLGKITNGELKAAVVRALVTSSDPASIVPLLQGAGPMSFVIARDEDPLLAALSRPSSPQAVQLLLELLARADMTAVSSSDRLRQSLEQIATVHQKEAGVRQALLELALGQCRRLPYEAPLKRERSGAATRIGSAFEAVLASMAATGPDEKTAQTAAVTLLKAGRITILAERLAQADPKRRKKVVDTLAADKELVEQEALPAFLAARLTDPEAAVVQSAAAGLAIWQKRLDPKRRWRFNLGIKQGVEWRQLVEVSAGANEKAAGAAADLLASLAMLSSAEASEFTGTADRAAREQRLLEADQQRQAKPAGPYMAMVYIDVKPFEAPPGAAPAEPPSTQPQTPLLPRSNMPLAALEASLQPAGTSIRVLVEGSDLTISPFAGPGGAAPGAGPKINGGLLLRAALASPAAAKTGIADQIDLSALNEPRECELRFQQLGTWACDISLPESSTPVPGHPLKLLGARIILEPVPAR